MLTHSNSKSIVYKPYTINIITHKVLINVPNVLLNLNLLRWVTKYKYISTTNLAACVCVCQCAKCDQFLPHALISTPNVPKICHVDRKSRGPEVTWTGSHMDRKSRGQEVTWAGSHVDRKSRGPEVTWTGSHVDRKSRGQEITWTGNHVDRRSKKYKRTRV